MSDRTVYVYDKETGKIQYTIDEANDAQIENLKNKNISAFVSTDKYKTVGTYVKMDDKGVPISIAPVEHMDFITVNKSAIVANGTDEAIISG